MWNLFKRGPSTIVKRAERLYRAQQYPEFIALVEPALAAMPESDADRLVLLRFLGVAYFETGRLDEARACLEKCCEAAAGKGDAWTEAACLHELSMVLMYSDDLEGARAYCERSMEMLKQNGLTTLPAMHTLAVIYIEMGRLDEAQELLEQVRSEARRQHEFAQWAKACGELGILLAKKGDPKAAVENLALAIRIKRGIRDKRGCVQTMLNLISVLEEFPEVLQDPEVSKTVRQLERLIPRLKS